MSELEEGRTLDRIVAERVMGLPITGHLWELYYEQPGGERRRVPPYSTDINAAWEVVEEMKKRWASQENAKAGEPDRWVIVDMGDEGWVVVVEWLHHDGVITECEVSAPTAPLAICKAALAIVGDNE